MREAASLTNGAAVVDWRRLMGGVCNVGFGIAAAVFVFVGVEARDVAWWVVGASLSRL